MSAVLSDKIVKTRVEHRCFGCARLFPKKTMMHRQGVVDGGSVWTSYLCETCYGIACNMDWRDEFGYADLQDEALEIEAKEKKYTEGGE